MNAPRHPSHRWYPPARRRQPPHQSAQFDQCGHRPIIDRTTRAEKLAKLTQFDCRDETSYRRSTGFTNFNPVCVAEKPTTFTSFKFALRHAATTSFSLRCLLPFG